MGFTDCVWLCGVLLGFVTNILAIAVYGGAAFIAYRRGWLNRV